MLASFFMHRGGNKNKQGQQQGNQSGKQQKKGTNVFIPAKFHGVLTTTDHRIVEQPDTFEIPFGVPVDPIFDYIRTNQNTKIEPILASGYSLNARLYTEVYLHGILAIYYGHVKAVNAFRDQLVIALQTVNTPLSLGAATYIKAKVNISYFLEKFRDTVKDQLDALYGETFDNAPTDKANAILSIPLNKLLGPFLKSLSKPSSGQSTPGRPSTGGPNKSNQGKKKKGGSSTYVGGGVCEDTYRHIYNLLKSGYYKGKYINTLTSAEDIKEFLNDLDFEMKGRSTRKIFGVDLKTLIAACNIAQNNDDVDNANTISNVLRTIAKITVPIGYERSNILIDPFERFKRFRKPGDTSEGPPAYKNTKSENPETSPNGPCGYFEGQSDLLSCGRHALNNLYGRRVFVKEVTDASRNKVPQKINFTYPTEPISLTDFCKKLTLESTKLGLKTDIFKCKPNENYNITVIQYAIFLMGDVFTEFPIAKLPEFITYTAKYDATQSLDMIINLGDITAGKTTGIHWVTAKSDTTHCYYDSLQTKPVQFDSRDELIDYIAELKFTHILVIDKLNPVTPVNILQNLKDLVVGPPTTITEETDEKKVLSYLESIETSYSSDYSKIVSYIEGLYPLIIIPTGGAMTGGKYTGARYVTFRPDNMTPTPASPQWYKIPSKNQNSLNLLQFAVGYGSVDSVRLLIRKNANFEESLPGGMSLFDLAKSRKGNDSRTKGVQDLLTYVTKAVSAARKDYGSKEIKDDYVGKSNISDNNEKEEKDVLNYVYSKEYDALKQSKGVESVLGLVEKQAKQQGRQDALDGKAEDESQSKNPSEQIRNAYSTGYNVGKAERIGTIDGNSRVTTPRLYYSDPNTPVEIRDAYTNAYQKAKGAIIYKGFKDGITGKESNPPVSQFLQFDPKFASDLKFDVVDSAVKEDYEAGYNFGLRIFSTYIQKIIDNGSEQDGRIDGFNGDPMYTKKYIIKEKPLLGGSTIVDPVTKIASIDPSKAITFGKEEEFEVEYDKLSSLPVYRQNTAITLDVSKVPNVQTVTTMGGTDVAYGEYIKKLYEFGYNKGQEDKRKQGRGRGKTYRRKRHGKTKTYKKKLSRR